MDHQRADEQTAKNPSGQAEGAFLDRDGSAEADLGQDALAGQQLSAEADDEAHHGQTAVPSFSEVDEAEACVVRHGGEPVVVEPNVTKVGLLLPVLATTLGGVHSLVADRRLVKAVAVASSGLSGQGCLG